MLKALTIAAALGLAGTAAAQNAGHANHAGHAGHTTAAKSAVVTVPADGAMVHGAPETFSATFPHPMTLRSLSLGAEGQPATAVTVAQAAPAAKVSVALPRLAPGQYTEIGRAHV